MSLNTIPEQKLAITYDVASFVTALFLLDYGADKFIDHTVVIARRTGIPQAIIALLTAGAEWEELIVVVAALAQGRSALAVGNVVGSSISNILGAFSLGLIFHDTSQGLEFDRSSRVYSLVLLATTTLISASLLLAGSVETRTYSLGHGIVLMVMFLVYVLSIAWAIARGRLSEPEASDSDTSDEEEGQEGSSESDSTNAQHSDAASRQPLLNTPRNQDRRRGKSISYHSTLLVIGFSAICLSGFVLSHAAINITDVIGMSDIAFGIIFLSIATTLPEKFVAFLSGRRGHAGVLVGTTVGSNIFLLTLCLGTILLDKASHMNDDGVNKTELAILWASTLSFTLTVWFGARLQRKIGYVMIATYVAFLVLEATVIRPPNNHHHRNSF